MSRSTARARVFKEQGTWYVELVGSDGVIINSDNTGSWRPIFEQGHRDVAHIRAVENMGHRLKSWDEVVEAAHWDTADL